MRCMYCGDDAGNAIDHYWPKARYPLLAYTWDNYLWACSTCNSNLKRDHFELDAQDKPLLLDPTVDEPSEFMRYIHTTGQFEPLYDDADQPNARAEYTIRLLDLNETQRKRPRPAALCQGRKDVWDNIVNSIVSYGIYRRADQAIEMDDVKRSITERSPFPMLLGWLLRQTRSANASLIFMRGQGPQLLATLREFPDIYDWV